jgi:hypothetical protein
MLAFHYMHMHQALPSQGTASGSPIDMIEENSRMEEIRAGACTSQTRYSRNMRKVTHSQSTHAF